MENDPESLLERAHRILDARGVAREGRKVMLPEEPMPLPVEHPKVLRFFRDFVPDVSATEGKPHA